MNSILQPQTERTGDTPEIRPYPPQMFAQARRFAAHLAELRAFLEQFIAEHDYAPSVREIQIGLHVSSQSVVAYRLNELEQRGEIVIARGIARGIRLVRPASRRQKRTRA